MLPVKPPKVKWSKLDKDCGSVLHCPQKEGDVGYDLEAADPYILRPNEQLKIDTNVQLEMPSNIWAEIRPRSSTSKMGMQCDGGTLDSGYRGPLFVILRNTSGESISISGGQRIAQVIFHEKAKIDCIEVDKINEKSERGDTGFGSTGTHI